LSGADIVLVKPGSQRQLYGTLGAFELTAIEPPLWAALLAGYLRSLGYAVELCDADIETAEKIKEVGPRIAAIVVSGTNPSASTMNMTGAGRIALHLRELDPEIKILMAGLHPSALPERTLADEETDFVCQGEGFYTLPKLIEALKNKADYYRIEGLWYRKNGCIQSNPRPPLWKNLDDLPMPAWDLLPMEKYRAHNWHCFSDIEHRQPYGVLYTTLGCPFHCNFCCINALFGKNTIRFRSTERVVEELEFLVDRYGIRNIKIIDEMFAFNETRVVSLCEAIAERGYDLNMWAYARVDTVSERMLHKMKEAGINWVAYGFESGSKRVIEEVRKGYKMEVVKKIVDMTYSLGMYICANFIFGLPEDDFDSMNETLELMLDINAEWANIYSAMAYPGSELYSLALEKQWPLPNSWEGFSQYSLETLPLPTKYLQPGEVLSFRDYAFHTYHESPRYLDKIRRLFGLDTVRHIKAMSQHRLERKHVQFS
jgi:anaerobic magnesium-protoporphyrin IX monomethyl ester cyclase